MPWISSRMSKFEKTYFRTFLYKLIEDLLMEGNPWEPPSNRIYGTQ
jgi:hypothetical protein